MTDEGSLGDRIAKIPNDRSIAIANDSDTADMFHTVKHLDIIPESSGISIEVSISPTPDMARRASSLCVMNAQGSLPLGNWLIRGTDNAGNTKIVKFSGYMPKFSASKNYESGTDGNMTLTITPLEE